MDRKAFINAYENASKQSKEEKLQYNPVQILALSMPTILGAGTTAITNTRQFRMYANTRQDPMRKKSLVNITGGLGRRIFLGGAVGLSLSFTMINYEMQLKKQRKQSIKEAMLVQGFDIDSGEGKTFLAEYKWGKMKEGMLSSSSGRMLSKKDDTAENLIKRVNFQNEIDDHKTSENRRFGQKNFFETESVEIKPDEIMPVRIDLVKNQIIETKTSKTKSIETKSSEAKTIEAKSSKTKSSETKSSETKSSEIQPFETVDAELNTTENESQKKLTNLKNPDRKSVV